jgi:hypothetical protein
MVNGKIRSRELQTCPKDCFYAYRQKTLMDEDMMSKNWHDRFNSREP